MFRQRAFVWWWVVQCYSMKWKTNFDRKRWYNTNILFLWIFSKICSGMYLRVWRRVSSLRLGMILLPWSSTISNKYLLYLSSKIFKSQWANEQCILVKDVAWRCANFIWFLKSCYQMMAQIWHQKNLIWKLGHIFEKAMTSPLKQDRLAKAYNALTRSRFREVTEDSPDYDEYYDEETWAALPCQIETKIWKYVPQSSIIVDFRSTGWFFHWYPPISVPKRNPSSSQSRPFLVTGFTGTAAVIGLLAISFLVLKSGGTSEKNHPVFLWCFMFCTKSKHLRSDVCFQWILFI